MKFSFDISDIIFKPITLITGKDIPTNQRRLDKLCIIVNELGFASAAAQNLHTPITTLSKLKVQSDQRLYIMREENQILKNVETEISSRDDLHMFNSGGFEGHKDFVNDKKFSIVGMIKVGVKTLYVVDELNRQVEINPLCVLDFYIDSNLQRKGYGRRLFEYMLQMEVISPQHLAYDRPSVKFLSFLKKYYNLCQFIPQANNFVVFKEYGLQNLELDNRGRPKTTSKFLQNGESRSNGNRRKNDSYEHAPEGLLSKKYRQIFEGPEYQKEQEQNIYPFSFYLMSNQSVIPPISNGAGNDIDLVKTPTVWEPENDKKIDMIESRHKETPQQMVLTHKPFSEDIKGDQERTKSDQQFIHSDQLSYHNLFNQPPKELKSGHSSKRELESNHASSINPEQFWKEVEPINAAANGQLEPLNSSLKELGPIHTSRKELDPISNSYGAIFPFESSSRITTSTNITLLKPLVYQQEVERQHRIATLVAETHLQSRIAAIPIALEPLKVHMRPAGIKSGVESRKRNFQHRYNNRSTLQG